MSLTLRIHRDEVLDTPHPEQTQSLVHAIFRGYLRQSATHVSENGMGRMVLGLTDGGKVQISTILKKMK